MRSVFICIVLLIATDAACWAAVVRLLEEGPGQYRIEAEGLSGVAALDLSINYDSSTLQILNISQGALLQGMLFVGNPNRPGLVRIGAIGAQPISGSGTLARFSGSVKNDPAVILGFTAKLSETTGKTLPVRTAIPVSVQIDRPSAPPRIENLPDSSDTEIDDHVGSYPSTTNTQGNSSFISTGQVNSPAPWGSREPESPPTAETSDPYLDSSAEQERQSSSDPPASEWATVPYIEKQQFGFSSILEAFEKYEGPRTLAKMALLFKRDATALQQRPEIFLADGEASVEIDLLMRSIAEPSIALKNALLIRAAFVAENRFVVCSIPEQGALSAKILILGGNEIIAIPLTVAPAVSLNGIDVKAEGLLPKLDLDGDGGSTWKDDYILVANLLAQGKIGKNAELIK